VGERDHQGDLFAPRPGAVPGLRRVPRPGARGADSSRPGPGVVGGMSAHPVVLSYWMGADSTALLLRWIHEPDTRHCDLASLLVVTAVTGDEWPVTGRLVAEHVLPLLRQSWHPLRPGRPRQRPPGGRHHRPGRQPHPGGGLPGRRLPAVRRARGGRDRAAGGGQPQVQRQGQRMGPGSIPGRRPGRASPTSRPSASRQARPPAPGKTPPTTRPPAPAGTR